jgi:hypothetical protein
MTDATTVTVIDLTTDEATGHLTRRANNAHQVIGHSHSTDKTTSHPTKQPKDGCQVVGYKPASGQVAGYPAQAGIRQDKRTFCLNPLDSRLRGNDKVVDSSCD